MAINLEKGARINLSKESGLNRVRFGLGWGENPFDTGAAYDLDGSVFMLTKGKLEADKNLVFYGNLGCPNGAVKHSGDNKTGNAPGEDEQVFVDLNLLSQLSNIDELSFVVTIHDADKRNQNFGQIPGSVVNIYNDENNELLATYELEESFSTETAVQVGSLYKKDGQWLFKAVGAGFKKGLGDFILAYGGEVA